MESRGEDPPSLDDVQYFGLYEACKRTRGEFAIYDKDKCFAARGRFGMNPLYWNRDRIVFSFEKVDNTFEEFPEGHLYDVNHDRLVCWDPVYFDKPLNSNIDESVIAVRKLLNDAIDFRVHRCDAFLVSDGYGSIVIDSFLEKNNDIDSYSAFFNPDVEPCIEYDENLNRTAIFINKCYQNKTIDESLFRTLVRFVKNHTTHKKFLCGIGCDELFSPDESFKPDVSHFASSGIELSSPFLDSLLVEYVLDMTLPKSRPVILRKLLFEIEEEE